MKYDKLSDKELARAFGDIFNEIRHRFGNEAARVVLTDVQHLTSVIENSKVNFVNETIIEEKN